jgi:hypothetical protein
MIRHSEWPFVTLAVSIAGTGPFVCFFSAGCPHCGYHYCQSGKAVQMGTQLTVAIARALLLAGVMAGSAGHQASAETLVEHSAESRFQLDFHVPDAALQNALPAGWEPAIATAGPAKDANLRLIFVDRVGITGADGKPVGAGTNRMAILAIPVKQTATGVTGQMIIGGLTEDPADAPGPFGVYLPATVHRMERSYKVGAGSGIAGEETWDFQAAGGEHLAVHVTYERGAPVRLGSETKFFAGTDPNFYQIVRIERGVDIMRNATINVCDRVREFRYTVSGGKFAALFDGTERVLSWDAIPWHNRAIYRP